MRTRTRTTTTMMTMKVEKLLSFLIKKNGENKGGPGKFDSRDGGESKRLYFHSNPFRLLLGVSLGKARSERSPQFLEPINILPEFSNGTSNEKY